MPRRLRPTLLFLAMALVTSCAHGPPPVPTSLAVDYQTGSIPPPFNYAYALTGMFEGNDLVVRYDLIYRLREGMTLQELTEQGYSQDDDIHWQGVLSGTQVDAWRAQASTRMGPIPPQLPGGDSFVVTIRYADGRKSVGLPEQRAAWEVLVDAVDQPARAETGHPRPSR